MFATIEAAIIARLSAKLDGIAKVTSLSELALIPELRNKAPAVFVVYEGFSPAESVPTAPQVQGILQTWAIVCVAKNAKGGGDTNAAKEDVSAMAKVVLQALLGFQVSPGVRLSLAAAPGPEYEGGFCYLPIGFSCRSTFKGDPS